MIIEFVCSDCGFTKDYFFKTKIVPDQKPCEKCPGKMKQKFPLPSRPVFKGSGFYETDYKRGKNG